MGSFIHIAAYCMIEAPGGVEMRDFSGLAGRCTIYGGSDDYSGNYLTNPCVPLHTRKIECSRVLLKEHAVIRASSVILLGVTIGQGSAVGAMSLVMRSVPDFEIHVGVPAKFVRKRYSDVIKLGNNVFEAQKTDVSNGFYQE